jgi:hypothetical protein
MKDDFKRIIIDIPRKYNDAYASYRYTYKYYDEDSDYWNDTRETISRYEKSLHDRLSPLYRFLKSKCGKPWDDVWSEICSVNTNHNLKGMHLREHVLRYVSRNTISREGESWWYSRSWGFIVDENGILQEKKKYYKVPSRKKNTSTENRFVKIINDKPHVLTQHGWFACEGVYITYHGTTYGNVMVGLPKYKPNATNYIYEVPYCTKYLIQEDKDSFFIFTDKRPRESCYLATKWRQCNKHEIKKKGLV